MRKIVDIICSELSHLFAKCYFKMMGLNTHIIKHFDHLEDIVVCGAGIE